MYFLEKFVVRGSFISPGPDVTSTFYLKCAVRVFPKVPQNHFLGTWELVPVPQIIFWEHGNCVPVPQSFREHVTLAKTIASIVLSDTLGCQ